MKMLCSSLRKLPLSGTLFSNAVSMAFGFIAMSLFSAILVYSEESLTAIKDPLLRNPIQLKFRNPQSYTNNVLAMIVPRILNPYGNQARYMCVEAKEYVVLQCR